MIYKNTIKAAFIALVMAPVLVFAQADMPPTNDLANPYLTQSGYFKLPAGRGWGSSSTVDIHPDGESVWIAERCAGNINACVQRPDTNLVMLFDKDGNLVRSFGAGYIAWPHGIHVDSEGNVFFFDAGQGCDFRRNPELLAEPQRHTCANRPFT